MNQSIAQITNQKEKQYQSIRESENKILELIYKGLVDNLSVKEISKKIAKVSTFKSKSLLINTNKILRTLEKKDEKLKNKNADFIYLLLFTKFKLDKRINKGVYQELNEIESKAKNKAIDDLISKSRKDEQVFYVCSKHLDCAKDHLKYQGKVYVDANWPQVIKDKETKKQISDYLAQFNIKTFQWVVADPVYMTTRPNCRHFFEAFSFDEVSSIKNMDAFLKENNMWFESGYSARTLRHSLNRQWYNATNLTNIVERYEERLNLHQSLYKAVPCDELKSEISKDKALIRKWKGVFNKLYGKN